VILSGRVARTVEAWDNRVKFAEAFSAKVITDFKVGSTFPTEHPLSAGPSGYMLQAAVGPVLRNADAIVNLDFIDFAGALKQVWGETPPTAAIVSASLDRYTHNGWSMDHFGFPPVDLEMVVDPDVFIAKALALMGPTAKPASLNGNGKAHVAHTPTAPAATNGEIGVDSLSNTLNDVFSNRKTCYIRLPLGAAGSRFNFRHPLDYLGYDGGGGVGSGPGMAVGAALALRGTDRLPVAVLGDGDYLMASSALWTAVANEIPLLVIVSNNRSYFNDELHQDRMARLRGRPVERRWIGQRIDGPAPHVAANARSFGAVGIGPIAKLADLAPALSEAIAHLEAGKVVVLDVLVTPGYDPDVDVATVIENVTAAAH
jgi:thiamine pyrophosphate-dependent acetolactate synthase large subunit-like protein